MVTYQALSGQCQAIPRLSGDLSDTKWTVSGYPKTDGGDLSDTEWTVSGHPKTDSGDISDTEWTVSGHPETGSHGVQHQPIQKVTDQW